MSGQPAPQDASANRGQSIVAYNAVMIAIPSVAVVLRFWSRSLPSGSQVQRGKYWWDDWMVLTALPWCIATNSLAIVLVHFGLGRHIATISSSNLAEAEKVLFATYLIYDTGLTLAKSSALLFFLRIFESHSSWFRRAVAITQALVWSWWIGIVFGTIFMCNPVSKNWKPAESGLCGSTGSLWVGSAVPSVFIDIIILILPLPMLWKLHMPPLRKLLITGIFICGYSVVVISIGRLITVTTSEAAINADLTWAGVDALFWLAAETPITIFSVCLPAIFVLIRHIYRHGLSSTMGSDRSHLNKYFKYHTSANRTGPTGRRKRSALSETDMEFGSNFSTRRDNTTIPYHSHQADTSTGVAVHISAGGTEHAPVPKTGIPVQIEFEMSRE